MLCSDSILHICLDIDSSQLSRANLDKYIQIKDFPKGVNSVQLIADKGFTYLIVYICKIWILSDNSIKDFIESGDFSSLKSIIAKEIATFIYSSSKLSPKTILLKINEAKGLFQSENLEPEDEDITENTEENIEEYTDGEVKPAYTVTRKPICELLFIANRHSIESLEYTHSEETGKAETSFRLSNTITGRFPRLSGSSIALMETPSKDTKKSFGEYAEFMESPRFSSITTSPNKIFNTTPITSPKQSIYSIQEVKNVLLPANKNLANNSSPFDKKTIKKVRSPGVRAFSFRDSEYKSVTTDIYFSTELNRSRTAYEDKKTSCQCQSCYIF